MSTTTNFNKDTFGKDVKQKLYRSMIGTLLYLTMSHPDISFSVRTCARYQANLKQSHLISIKILYVILVGLQTTSCGILMIHLLLWLDIPISIGLEMLRIGKAHQMLFFSIGDCLMAWLSRKQNLISLSIVEVEYIVVRSCCTQLLQMK